MQNSLKKMLKGYQAFREKYASGDQSVMQYLSDYGQRPDVMVIACCDSRVDPALILQCDPGDLFVVRNVANIVPPYENDHAYHGTSAALEFAIKFLKVKRLVLLGHSQCGGIHALLNQSQLGKNDFISNWVSIINQDEFVSSNVDQCAKMALHQSYQNCLSFPWLKEAVEQGNLIIHQWFFDIKQGQIFNYSEQKGRYLALNEKDM